MAHLLRIDEIRHLDKDGNILWQANGLNNLMHAGGEAFLLNLAFNISSGITVPNSYYVGLDNRATPSLLDTLANLSAEPTQNGYARQAVSSFNGFTIAPDGTGNERAKSGIVSFGASGGSWGPVQVVFLATDAGNTGFLISSVMLTGAARTLNNGETLAMQVSVGLANC